MSALKALHRTLPASRCAIDTSCWQHGWSRGSCWPATTASDGLSDWLYFEFGARTLIHYNSHYGGGALSLYANHPVIQIGPPPLLVVAAVQWLPHDPSSVGLAALMALVGLWALRCAEVTARELLPVGRARTVTLRALWAGVPALAMWSYEAAQWRHFDDVMAITFTLWAASLIARRRMWWLRRDSRRAGGRIEAVGSRHGARAARSPA